MSPVRFALALAVLALPASALAQLPRMKVAIDVNRNRSLYSTKEAADSVARRVMSFVTPGIEARGYEVVRVKNWRDAAHSGLYEAVVRLEINAREVVIVRNAWVTDKEDAPTPVPRPVRDQRKALHVDDSWSVEAWARWKAWDGRSQQETGDGEIPRLVAGIQGQGDSATLDDEENVARLIADEIVQSVLPAIDLALTPVEIVPR